MANPRDKLNETFNSMSDFEVIETLDFIEFIQHKRSKEIKEVLENALEVDEKLSEEEIKAVEESEEEFQAGETLTFNEIFKKND